MDRFGRNRPEAFPKWCDTGKKTYDRLRHTLGEKGEVIWDVRNDTHLPHYDHIEMTGLKVSSIISYGVDEDSLLKMNRHLIFPSLRMIPNETRGSLTHNFPVETSQVVYVDGRMIKDEKVTQIEIYGELKLTSVTNEGLQVVRRLFPSMKKKALLEHVTVVNISEKPLDVEIRNPDYYEESIKEESVESFYCIEANILEAVGVQKIKPGASVDGTIVYSARSSYETIFIDATQEAIKRKEFLDEIEGKLILETPDSVVNDAFRMTKWRTSESIIKTKGGLMHAPGGGDYYAALWTNDQCEYVNPLFPFMGYELGIKQSINAYEHFMRFMDQEGIKPLVSSIVAEGDSYWNGAGDRGDAAMFMYGASRFVLALGDAVITERLWPGIKWCLTYNLSKINSDGVVESDSDELENRFESGKANLFTSCLVYDGLQSVAMLIEAMAFEHENSKYYLDKASDLKEAIETYFGKRVEGYESYQYYQGNKVLRSWICMPLVVGIDERAEGTIEAMFNSRLWTEDGLSTQAGEETFWDRSTLFALRGTFYANRSEVAYEHLMSYTKNRLLGEHVPYPVEAYPEGNQRHLAGESALYVRIFIEGVFGIRPTGFKSFTMKPSLPLAWPTIKLSNIYIGGDSMDIFIETINETYLVTITYQDGQMMSKHLDKGETLKVFIP